MAQLMMSRKRGHPIFLLTLVPKQLMISSLKISGLASSHRKIVNRQGIVQTQSRSKSRKKDAAKAGKLLQNRRPLLSGKGMSWGRPVLLWTRPTGPRSRNFFLMRCTCRRGLAQRHGCLSRDHFLRYQGFCDTEAYDLFHAEAHLYFHRAPPFCGDAQSLTCFKEGWQNHIALTQPNFFLDKGMQLRKRWD